SRLDLAKSYRLSCLRRAALAGLGAGHLEDAGDLALLALWRLQYGTIRNRPAQHPRDAHLAATRRMHSLQALYAWSSGVQPQAPPGFGDAGRFMPKSLEQA